jgi:hypothetical protein
MLRASSTLERPEPAAKSAPHCGIRASSDPKVIPSRALACRTRVDACPISLTTSQGGGAATGAPRKESSARGGLDVGMVSEPAQDMLHTPAERIGARRTSPWPLHAPPASIVAKLFGYEEPESLGPINEFSAQTRLFRGSHSA